MLNFKPQHIDRQALRAECAESVGYTPLDAMSQSVASRNESAWYEKHVVRNGVDECWGWNGARTAGYGVCYFRGALWRANRISWVLSHGEIPTGLEVMHQCDTPECSNPAHLKLGTHKENMEDMVRKGRARGKVFRGEDNVTSKLTAANVRQIRSQYAAGGVRMQELAATYGVCESTVRQLIRRITWRHVE